MTQPPNEPTVDDVILPTEDVHPDHREHGKTPRPPDVDELRERAAHEQREVEQDRRS
jgi:hypothetical protein